jgi:hypothetical protein
LSDSARPNQIGERPIFFLQVIDTNLLRKRSIWYLERSPGIADIQRKDIVRIFLEVELAESNVFTAFIMKVILRRGAQAKVGAVFDAG